MRVWSRMLSDVDGAKGRIAITQLCASGEHPPTIAEIRKLATLLRGGRLSPPTAFEAWERALDGRCDTDVEKRALKCCGGEWEIRHGENIGVTRSNFVRAYNDFLTTAMVALTALPEARFIAAENRQSEIEYKQTSEESEIPTPPNAEELAALLAGLNGRVSTGVNHELRKAGNCIAR